MQGSPAPLEVPRCPTLLSDRSVQETAPLGNVATVAYDANGRQSSTTDRFGQVIDFSYDLLNRETGESWFNAGGTQVNTLTFTHDPNDNLLTAVNSTSANTMGYDALDRLASVQLPFGAVLTNTWDAADNRLLVQDSQGGTTTQVFDALNRMTTMLFSGNSATLREDFGYTARDQVATQTRYSDLLGTATIGYSPFTYDSVGRLTNLVHQNGTGTTLANMTNTYDLASRITAETLNGGTPTSYGYDNINELISDALNSYSYDLSGNRTMTGYATGPANEMNSDGTWNYFFDKNGNVIAKVNITTGEALGFAYDNLNRLISALDVTTALQMQATYGYDALGRRIEKDVWTQTSGSTTTTRFAYDGDEIWADLTSANALQMRYLRGVSVLELLARVAGGGTVAWMLIDRMGSVRQVVDGTGAVIDTITYDGYGNVTAESNATNGGSYKPFGYRMDSETGWLRPDPSRERYYASATGRWMQGDSAKFQAGDCNLYRYVGNDPTNATDPSGLLGIIKLLNQPDFASFLRSASRIGKNSTVAEITDFVKNAKDIVAKLEQLLRDANDNAWQYRSDLASQEGSLKLDMSNIRYYRSKGNFALVNQIQKRIQMTEAAIKVDVVGQAAMAVAIATATKQLAQAKELLNIAEALLKTLNQPPPPRMRGGGNPVAIRIPPPPYQGPGFNADQGLYILQLQQAAQKAQQAAVAAQQAQQQRKPTK